MLPSQRPWRGFRQGRRAAASRHDQGRSPASRNGQQLARSPPSCPRCASVRRGSCDDRRWSILLVRGGERGRRRRPRRRTGSPALHAQRSAFSIGVYRCSGAYSFQVSVSWRSRGRLRRPARVAERTGSTMIASTSPRSEQQRRWRDDGRSRQSRSISRPPAERRDQTLPGRVLGVAVGLPLQAPRCAWSLACGSLRVVALPSCHAVVERQAHVSTMSAPLAFACAVVSEPANARVDDAE